MRTWGPSVAALLLCAAAGHAVEPACYDRAADKHPFTVFMEQAGWCWYQDPRAIIHDGKLLLGAVRGNGLGEARVGIYDLRAKQRVGSVILHPEMDRDDHNSPVFSIRKDGSVLASYARHGRDAYHRSRISHPGDLTQWTAEAKHLRKLGGPRDKVTYSNLCYLKDEDRLYNFFRGIDYNPTYVTSRDQGRTWSEPVHFFRSEAPGRHRPYPRYACDGQNTIHVSVTDAHPRDFGNSIYYFAFRNGRFHRADGTVIKDLAREGPLKPSQAERIFQGSRTTEKPPECESVPGAAWTSSIAIDQKGRPHIAYTLYKNNDDHRYRLASWDGERWIDREIAQGGGCLYPRESSYTGLITLDPGDPSLVFISTDVDPTTGESLGGPHEIYRAYVALEDSLDTIRWQAVTQQSPVRNIRPLVVRDGPLRVVLWNRGDFRSYTNYELDAVGFVETAD